MSTESLGIQIPKDLRDGDGDEARAAVGAGWGGGAVGAEDERAKGPLPGVHEQAAPVCHSEWGVPCRATALQPRVPQEVVVGGLRKWKVGST